MTRFLPPEEVAILARVSPARIRRVLREIQHGTTRGPRHTWRGAGLHVIEAEGGLRVDAASLPIDLRERICLRDQMSLPLPPRNTVFWNARPGLKGHRHECCTCWKAPSQR